jgi:hypothetical protein
LRRNAAANRQRHGQRNGDTNRHAGKIARKTRQAVFSFQQASIMALNGMTCGEKESSED